MPNAGVNSGPYTWNNWTSMYNATPPSQGFTPADAAAGRINPADAQNYPRETMAGIIRGQWNDFQNTTIPIIKSLEDMTTYGGNTGVVEGLKTDARNNAKAAYGDLVPDAQRNAQSYGMSLTPSAQGTLERSAKLGMTAASVDGVNRANTFQQDLNRQIAAGANLSTVKQG